MTRTYPWLVSARFDLLAYSAITLYAAVFVLVMGHVVEPEQIFFWFNVVFTLAHYGPTWIRSFLDKKVRRENRWQILFFPPAFFAFAFATQRSPQALAFVLFTWDRFHALLQNYGFLRLYEARAGKPVVTPWVERALLFSGALLTMSFNLGLLTQPLARLAELGVPLPYVPSLVTTLRAVFGAATAVSAVAYAWQLRRGVKAGQALNVPKLAFLVAMFGGHWVMNLSSNIFLLSAHEKVYHSVQYLVLTQRYNARRAQTAPRGELTKAFQALSRAPLYLAYVALWTVAVFLVAQWVQPVMPTVTTAPLNAVVGGMALSHYFFDSFLWRVRRPEVKANL